MRRTEAARAGLRALARQTAVFATHHPEWQAIVYHSSVILMPLENQMDAEFKISVRKQSEITTRMIRHMMGDAYVKER